MEQLAQSAVPTAEDAPVELLSRRHQVFPVLSDADIARVRRFGSIQDFKRGETLCAAGGPAVP
jgi:thioredoxin reductase (NADPH)